MAILRRGFTGTQAKSLCEKPRRFLTRARKDKCKRLAEWREQLANFSGQWTVVQDTLEVAEDPQTVANGYIQDCRTASGTPFRLTAAPVEFGEEPPVPQRAPEFNEHGDEILGELGLDWDTIVDLKVRGVVA